MSSAPIPPITVRHAAGHYPVYVEPGILGQLKPLIGCHLGARPVALITDTTVGRLYAEWESGASSVWRSDTDAGDGSRPAAYGWATRLSVPPGEDSKSRRNWMELSDALLDCALGRDAGLVTLGGGMIGDLGGFVAATYLRGIPYIQVPTTVLAMIDASVGGKTGVNTEHGKNLIGAFHAPAAVVADPLTLRSLSERDYRSGLAEAVKHGLISDSAYFEWIEASAERLGARDLAALTALIGRSVAIKAAVVQEDERESGRRATLNAGHTVAHALEHESGYRLAHGEAVSLGLVAECDMAERLGLAPSGLRGRVAALLERLGLPIRLPFPLAPELLLSAMSMDKKNRVVGEVGGANRGGASRGTEVRCALPTRLGEMYRSGEDWTVAVDAAVISAGLATIA